MSTIWRRRTIVVALGLIELALTVSAARVVGRETTYPIYLALYFAMGVPWLLACYYVIAETTSDRWIRNIVLVVAVAMRVPFLATEPTLSDDIYRYVWDGRVQRAGINPYLHAPESRELAFLRDDLYGRINNKDIPTIYPPFMEMAFFVATIASERISWMKGLFTLADLALIFVLARLLYSLGHDPARSVVYAWSPLVIVEIAGSGHNDVLAVLCLIAALSAIVRRKDVLAMSLLALSGLGKLVGFALSPLFLRSARLRAFLAIAAVTAACAWPYAEAGGHAFRGLTQYGLRWRANDSLFHILSYVTGSLDTAKVLVAGALVLMVLWLVFLDSHPLRSSYLTVGAILLLTTTVHPWYLLWIAPFLAIYTSPAWLFLSLSVALSYHSAYLATPGEPWEDVVWIKCLEYVPFFTLAGWALVRRLGGGRDALRCFLGLNSRP